ncbi:zf-HC2 domain-containing protein [Paenibacillus sp. 2TAB23]|uniref:zf-HC2 domain-containing protein n=1 Tax=Paenibacillus sp. 2TAB23 TaxID=3233004 RepID=UPI003F9E0167
MNCQEVMELMQRQLDDDLSDSELDVLMSHTRQCPDCAAMFERLQLLSAELTSLPKVIPSYSLVDAIMPQLEQMERLDQLEETVPVVSKVTELTPRRAKRVRKWPSIRVMSGVIAAGIVAGLFLVTYNTDMAPDFKANMFTASSSDDSAANEAQVAPQRMALKSDQSEDGAGEVSTETVEVQKHSDDMETDSLNNEEALKGVLPSSVDGDRASGEGTSGGAGSEDKGIEAGGTSDTSNGSAGDKEQGDFESSAVPAMISPDGKYGVQAANFKIDVIAQADQSIVFTTPRKNGELLNLAWSADSTLLTYEVHVENGAIEKYEIDLATLTEKKAAH